MKNSKDTIGNRTHEFPACGAVPQPTAPPRAQRQVMKTINIHKDKHNFDKKILPVCSGMPVYISLQVRLFSSTHAI
jgi:hypothetical protein